MSIFPRVVSRLAVVLLLTALALKLVLGEYEFPTVSAGGFLGALTVMIVFPFAYEAWTLLSRAIRRDKSPYEFGALIKRWFTVLLIDDWSDKKTKKRKRTK